MRKSFFSVNTIIKEDIKKYRVSKYKKTINWFIINFIFVITTLFIFIKVGMDIKQIDSIAKFFDYYFSLETKSEIHKFFYEITFNIKFIISEFILLILRYFLSKKFLIKKTEEEIEKEINKKILKIKTTHNNINYISLFLKTIGAVIIFVIITVLLFLLISS